MARVAKAVGWFLALFLFLSVQPAYADERSFRIGEASIHAGVDKEGNMHVTEVDKYHFEGAFHGIVVELDSSKSDGIYDFQAFEISGRQYIPLRSELSSAGDSLQYKIYSEAQDESKVFQFTYTVKNVVQVYADTAELYWKFFDSRNPSALEIVNIDVELPDGAAREEIAAFGHGPSHGVVQIEGNGVVRYRISPLPAGKLLEVRILFPGSYVPGSTRISGEAKLEAIMEEEMRWAGGGDDRSVYGALALLIANLVGGWYLKFRGAFRPEWKGKYYRELPGDITPAVVGYLKKYRVKPRDLMATMVDLVRKKRVQMQMAEGRKRGRHEVNYTFRLLDDSEDKLQPHEMSLINWFFKEMGEDDTVSLSDIRRYTQDKDNASAFRKRWSQWQDEVAQAAVRIGYVESQKWIRRVVQLTAVIQFFGIWFLAADGWRWLMFCAIPLFFLLPGRNRKTKLGQSEYAKWNAFKRFLSDYSRLASREPPAVHLWEHYFVYAIPLGVAKKMIAMTRIKVPNAEQDSVFFDSPYFYHYETWTESFEQSLGAANHSESSEDSGGSFSSGGGGGGGGGGRGAF